MESTAGKNNGVRDVSRMAIVALTGGELVYFELDEAGQLLELKRLKQARRLSA